MNVDKLKIGELYTYKQLCEILEIKYYPGGNVKARQLANLKDYIDYQKEKTKYRILDILVENNKGNDIKNNTSYDSKSNHTEKVEKSYVHINEIDETLFIEGLEFKSYKELCNYLSIKYPSCKDSKESQLKEIKRFVKLEFNGNKIKFVEVYDYPKEKEDKKMDALTGKIVGNRILQLMARFGDENTRKIYFSKGFLYRECMMCKEEWRTYKYNHDTLAKLDDIEKDLINDYYDITNRVFRANIDKGVKYIWNQRLGIKTDGYAVRLNGKSILVSEDEAVEILEYERNVLRYFGCSYGDLWKTKRYKEFYNTVVQTLREASEANMLRNSRLGHIDYYYSVIVFNYNWYQVVDYLEMNGFINDKDAFIRSSEKV